jgi:hypothetical protein
MAEIRITAPRSRLTSRTMASAALASCAHLRAQHPDLSQVMEDVVGD